MAGPGLGERLLRRPRCEATTREGGRQGPGTMPTGPGPTGCRSGTLTWGNHCGLVSVCGVFSVPGGVVSVCGLVKEASISSLIGEITRDRYTDIKIKSFGYQFPNANSTFFTCMHILKIK